MQRGYWVFLAAFSLVVALLALVIFMVFDDGGQAQLGTQTQQVKTYPVPPERAEAIRDSLRTVLLATREGVQPLGQASQPMPGMLVVSAPAGMQPSIEAAIRQLSDGANTAVDAAPARSYAFDIWVLEASEDSHEDDAYLATVKPVLDQAREIFGLGPQRVADRVTLVGSGNGGKPGAARGLHVDTRGLNANVNFLSTTSEAVDVEFGLSWRSSNASFFSSLTLRNNQWQVVSLLGGGGADSPERLLLVRQRPLDTAP